jgi:hypothetical protein
MFRIDNASAAPGPPSLPEPTTPIVTEAPDPAVPGSGGRYFTDGVRAGASATLIQSEWLNMVQEELCQVVVGASIALNKTDFTQLAAAFRIITGADDVAGGPGPGIGSSIPEPPQSVAPDLRYYSRNRDEDEPDGYWTRAIDEPPKTGFPYNRFVSPGQTPTPPERPYGDWKQSAGQTRLQFGASFWVSKLGSDTIGDGTAGRPWRTIQNAVDIVTRGVDASGKTVTINVRPSFEGDGLPYAGFRVVRPLEGAKTDGFKIMGPAGGDPDNCQIGQMARLPGTPGTYERYNIYVNNAQIAISGFSFVAQDVANIFICADENTAVVSLEGNIIFVPRVPISSADAPNSTRAVLQAKRGGTINIRANCASRSQTPVAGLYSTGQRFTDMIGAGKVLWSPGAIVSVAPGSTSNNSWSGPLHAVRYRSILDLGFTGGFAGAWNAPADLQMLGRIGIKSAGNAYQGGTRNFPIVPGVPGNVNPGTGTNADQRSLWSHKSSAHTGSPAGLPINTDPQSPLGGPNYQWAPASAQVP